MGDHRDPRRKGIENVQADAKEDGAYWSDGHGAFERGGPSHGSTGYVAGGTLRWLYSDPRVRAKTMALWRMVSSARVPHESRIPHETRAGLPRL